jgi:hypothetical protein
MKNRNLIYILIIIAITSFVFFKSNQNTKIDTSDWQTYENNEYGYRFKYPSDTNIVDGKDPQYSFYESPDSIFIILPGKYPNIKSPFYKDPKSFKNYEILITKEKYLNDKSWSNTDEIIQSLINSPKAIKKIIKKDDFTIAVYDNGSRVYFIGENDIYSFFLEGFDPNEKYVRGWLEQIDNPQLTEWVNDYPNYLKIFEGIYSTFEIIK